MPQALALVAKGLFGVRLHAVGVLDQRTQVRQPRLFGGRPGLELVVAPPRADQLAPREARVGAPPELVFADERVEHAELIRGPGEASLLELSRHREQPLADGCEVLARGAAAPRVGARSSVREDAPREHEPLLVLGPELGERGKFVLVEERGR